MQPASFEPPSFQELLENKALRTLYRWHMISLYCPENLLFRERVEDYELLWESGRSEQEIVESARKIVRDFCMGDSVMEINLDEKSRAKIVSQVDTPTRSMFSNALSTVDRDIARSLQAFYVSDAFLTFWEHRDLISRIANEEKALSPKTRGRSKTVGGSNESREEILNRVRKAFNADDKVCLKRHFDITSSFTYKVHLGDADGPHIGYGVQRGSVFYFYNLQEEQVLKVLSAALLGKTTTLQNAEDPEQQQEQQMEAVDDEVDDGVAGSGCCGGGGGSGGGNAARHSQSLKAPRSSTQAAPDWYVQDPGGQVHGPIKQISMQLLFRYHVLPMHVKAAAGEAKDFKPLESFPDVFSVSRMIETIDPTEVPSF